MPPRIIHPGDDPLASFEDVDRTVDRIPDAEFLPYGITGHLVFGHRDEVGRAVTDFVTSAWR